MACSTTKSVSTKEKIFRTILWSILEAFAVVSLIYICAKGENTQILMGIFTILLLCLPFAVCKIFKCELNSVFFVFCLLYAIGPMLGHIYKLYYLTTWWDDLLHASGGVVFAIFGVFLVEVLSQGKPTSFWLKALFALFFSIAIAALWEFVEYSCDQFFHTDMQNDRVVHDIYSYLLGGNIGETGAIHGIEEVFINGKSLGVGGYIDIGLHDTMSDMILESLGAVIFFVIYLVDKDRHPLIYKT